MKRGVRRKHREKRGESLAAPRYEEHVEVSQGGAATQQEGVGRLAGAQERRRGQRGGDLGNHFGLGFFLSLPFLSSAGRS